MPTILPHNPVRKGLWAEYPPPIGGGTICIFFLHLHRKAFHGVIFGQVRDDNHLVLKVIILDPRTVRFWMTDHFQSHEEAFRYLRINRRRRDMVYSNWRWVNNGKSHWQRGVSCTFFHKLWFLGGSVWSPDCTEIRTTIITIEVVVVTMLSTVQKCEKSIFTSSFFYTCTYPVLMRWASLPMVNTVLPLLVMSVQDRFSWDVSIPRDVQ